MSGRNPWPPPGAKVDENISPFRRAAERDLEEHPDCKGCQYNVKEGFGPPHDASKRCQSGGYDHCTCDTCF